MEFVKEKQKGQGKNLILLLLPTFRKAEIYAYNTDLELARIRLANWKIMHGGHAKAAQLVRKMGIEFEKVKIISHYNITLRHTYIVYPQRR